MALYEFNVARLNDYGTPAPLKTYIHAGATYVEGRKGSEYVLSFRNNSSHRVLVVPSVDGLSVMDGKPASVNSTGYIVDPWSGIAIPGWRIDNGKVAKFVFQPQGDSRDLTYVEALKADGVAVDAANQGVIGCLVFREKERERARGITISAGVSTREMDRSRRIPAGAISKGGPSLMSFNSAGPQSAPATMDFMEPQSASSVGTGFGEDREFRTRTVEFTRANPTDPDATFVVMYDTIQGLRRRGVPVDTVTNPLANAFPASPELARDGCRIPTRR